MEGNMKIIFLVDSSTKNFERMVEHINDKDILIINTERCDKEHEYIYLTDAIKEFSKSNNEIMLGKFSGREEILKSLGDECSEMIIPLSTNKNSRHYTEYPILMFLDLIRLFEKEIQ